MADEHTFNIVEQLTLRKLDYVRRLLPVCENQVLILKEL
jgi:hypothetical protein